MSKRGQVTVFAIIGIVVVVLIVLFLFIRSRVYIGPATSENLDAEINPIEEHIEDCLIEKSEPRIRQLGYQGGFLTTPQDTFRLNQDHQVSYLCYNIKDQPYCRSRVLTKEMMGQELSEFIKRDLESQCLRIQSFKKIGYDLNQGPLMITTSIGEDNVLVQADIPIKITKGSIEAERSKFSSNVILPLGRLYDSVHEIVNAEAVSGSFDTVPYSLAKTQLTNQPYVVQKLQPYPDKLYILKIKDTPPGKEYFFKFFIEGEPR